MTPGPLIIVSGPSGSGKSTLIDRLRRESRRPLRLSVSATTRAPRPGERDGIEYHFWTRERFEKERAAGGFLEWARVIDQYYGTLTSEVEPYLRQGVGVILDIDTQGARQVRQLCPDHVSVFVRAPSLAVYEERLRKRGTESEAAIKKRLAAAKGELDEAEKYQHKIINDDLDRAVAELLALVERAWQRDTHAG